MMEHDGEHPWKIRRRFQNTKPGITCLTLLDPILCSFNIFPSVKSAAKKKSTWILWYVDMIDVPSAPSASTPAQSWQEAACWDRGTFPTRSKCWNSAHIHQNDPGSAMSKPYLPSILLNPPYCCFPPLSPPSTKKTTWVMSVQFK